MSTTQIDLSRFISELSNRFTSRSLDDLLKLPKNEIYIQNEIKKSSEHIKSLD